MNKFCFSSFLCFVLLLSCKPYYKRILYPLSLNGIVENTWIDYSNHATRVVQVLNSDTLKEFYVVREENRLFYEDIQKGDSIFKEMNTLEFYLKKGRKKKKYQFQKYPY